MLHQVVLVTSSSCTFYFIKLCFMLQLRVLLVLHGASCSRRRVRAPKIQTINTYADLLYSFMKQDKVEEKVPTYKRGSQRKIKINTKGKRVKKRGS